MGLKLRRWPIGPKKTTFQGLTCYLTISDISQLVRANQRFLNRRNFVFSIWYQFWIHNFHHVVKKQRNNLAILGSFFDLQEFFKNRGFSFETSDSDFRDLLDELFHMVWKFFFKKKKKQNCRSYFKGPYIQN